MNALRGEQGRRKSDWTTPVMANGDESLETQRVSNADYIGREFLEGIRLDLMRFVRLAIPPHVISDRCKSSLGQDGELVPPAVPALRPAVRKNNQRPITLHGKPQRHAVGCNASEL